MRYPAHFPDEHPDDPRTYVPNIEFYITNVCNIACPQCNRFNDHKFTGYQKWSDYEAEYTEWATKIRLQKICILGGEPLLNPTICDWIVGINRLWNKRVQVLTNGTRLNHVPGLYEAMRNFGDNAGNWIGVSVHNANDLDRHFEEAQKFLKGNTTLHHKGDGVNNEFTWGADYAYTDENNVHVHYWVQDQFTQSAVQRDPETLKFKLHTSDAQQAHNECGFVQHQSHHFIKAKLYKCGPSGLLPEFDNQFKFDISDNDRKILHSYEPLAVYEFAQRGKEFIDNIDDVLDMCKFCPSNRLPLDTIVSLNKKRNSTSSFTDVIKK